MNSTAHDYVFKCVIIGDSHIGKTTLLRRYMGESCYTSSHGPQQTADTKHLGKILATGQVTKTLETDNTVINLKIHDTMGQERFRSLTRSYYRGAHGCLICFDVNNPASFDNLSTWLHDSDECITNDINCVKKLVGLIKPPLPPDHDSGASSLPTNVPISRAEDFADKHEIEYIEVHLSDSGQVVQCFHKLVESMIANRRKQSKGVSGIADSIDLSHIGPRETRTTESGCWC